MWEYQLWRFKNRIQVEVRVGYQLRDWYTTSGGAAQRSADGPHKRLSTEPRTLPLSRRFKSTSHRTAVTTHYWVVSTSKRAPLKSPSTNLTVQPWASTIVRTIARPKPEPDPVPIPYSKSSDRCSGRIPGPSSSI